MLLFLTAEKRGLFLQESRAGLVFTLFLNDLFLYLFFIFIFWHLWEEVLLSTQPCAGQPQSLVVLGLLGPKNDSQVGVCGLFRPQMAVGSEQLCCGKGSMCC